MTNNQIRRMLAGVLCGLLCVATAMASFQAYMTVQGKNQGKLKGESSRAGKSDIKLIGVLHVVEAPAARGARRGTIVVTKEVGAASPQLLQAFTTHEVLSNVAIEFIATGSGAGAGKVTDARNVVLSDATIASIKKGAHNQEEITFVYDKITVTNLAGKTSASDDWTTPDQ
jgi:type VI secretion system Hcp family effector